MVVSPRDAFDRLIAQDLASRDLLAAPAAPPSDWPHEPRDVDGGKVEQPDTVGKVQRSRRYILAAAAGVTLTVVTGVIAVPRTSNTAAYGATAPLLIFRPAGGTSAPGLLGDLAARAEQQPSVRGEGRYEYVHSRGWYFNTAQTTDGTVLSSGIDPSERELWIAADGSGRLRVTREGSDVPPSGIYQANGLATTPFGYGSPDEVRRKLSEYSSGRSAAQWFETMREIWDTHAVSPNLQSALLRILATRSDIVVEGLVTDRAGRQGVGVSTQGASNGLPARQILVLDPNSGLVLDYEYVALQADGLPISAPATLGYTVWLDRGRTDNTDRRP